ncbi:MAG: hypothetical protein DDT24_00564 [Chloroflexi bacterium]|nr:hypothetical protein [Chloroflexota bacterium]
MDCCLYFREKQVFRMRLDSGHPGAHRSKTRLELPLTMNKACMAHLNPSYISNRIPLARF